MYISFEKGGLRLKEEERKKKRKQKLFQSWTNTMCWSWPPKICQTLFRRQDTLLQQATLWAPVTPIFRTPATQDEPNSVTVTLKLDGRHIVAQWPQYGRAMAAINLWTENCSLLPQYSSLWPKYGSFIVEQSFSLYSYIRSIWSLLRSYPKLLYNVFYTVYHALKLAALHCASLHYTEIP